MQHRPVANSAHTDMLVLEHAGKMGKHDPKCIFVPLVCGLELFQHAEGRQSRARRSRILSTSHSLIEFSIRLKLCPAEVPEEGAAAEV